MMPQTVPKRPMNGAALAVVASQPRWLSSAATSEDEERNRARWMFSTRPAGSFSASPGAAFFSS
jgi:hypothetical protein